MKKRILLTPGPTSVPPEVLLAGAQPVVHHRAPDFRPVVQQVKKNLQYVFKTQNPVVFFAASGTGAMEATVAGLLSPGDKALTVVGGKFGERWRDLCKVYGMNTIVQDIEWGKAVKPEVIEKYLKDNPGIKAVYVTHCETSTGALTDIKAIGEVVAKTDAVLVVDAVSSLGAEELHTDAWKLDVVVTGSQKALMMPPGLAFASVSPKAQKLAEASKCPQYYFSLRKYLKSLDKDDTPYTPAVSMVTALQKSLEMIKEEGLENVWQRHGRLACAIRSGVNAIGLELLSDSPSNVVIAIKVPEGIDGEAIPRMMRDEFGITIAGGQEHLKGKIFRTATLGWADPKDAILAVSCLELTLKKLGYSFEMGAGTAAALAALAS